MDTLLAAELVTLVTDEMVADLRAMIVEPDDAAPYSTAQLKTLIARQYYSVSRTRYGWNDEDEIRNALAVNSAGYELDRQTTVAFDLNAAAYEIWSRKYTALIASGTFDFSGGQGSFSRSQKVQQFQQLVAFYRSRCVIRSRPLVITNRTTDR